MGAAEDLDLMTVEQFADITGISKKTIYECIQRKEIPGVRRIGRQFRIHRPTVLAWFATEPRK